MTEPLYDRTAFFAAYSTLRRSVEGLDGAPEWPTLRAMLPPLRGLRVVDLGCGFGWFSRWAAEQGTASVLGIDLSERMLQQARTASPSSVTYRQGDLATLSLPPQSFDLAYSSLALHYLSDLMPLLATLHHALMPGAPFVFSTEHPIYSAPSHQGWSVTPDGRRCWPLDGYHNELERRRTWFTPDVVKFHRTVGTILTTLIRAGFTLTQVNEFCPSADQITAWPDLEREVDRPMFLLVASVRNP